MMSSWSRIVAVAFATTVSVFSGCASREPVLLRIATVPLAAEVTGIETNAAGDLFFNFQHPSGAVVAQVEDGSGTPRTLNVGTIGFIAAPALSDVQASVALPSTDAEKQTVRSASGTYHVIAQVGDTFGGAIAQGLGIQTTSDGATALSTTANPDFNAFIDTSTAGDGSEGYLFTSWESRPGGISRLRLVKNGAGAYEVDASDVRHVEFSAVHGTWGNCFGSRSPWNTPLSAEELSFDTTAGWNDPASTSAATIDRLWQHLDAAMATATFPNPYRYGYIVEVTQPTAPSPLPVKRFALGRYSHEVGVVMPDRRTVYLSDDGANVVFFKFVASTAGDLSAGTLYAAKLTQDVDADGALIADSATAGFDIEWIELASGDEAQIAAWIANYDGISRDDFVAGSTSYISDAEIAAWASDKLAGMSLTDNRVAFLESRKAARALGATAELNKLEGLNINFEAAQSGSAPYLYMAMSFILNGMADGAGDVQLDENPCGIVYRLRFVDAAGGDYDVRRMEPAVAGGPFDATATVNACALDAIAGPDNLIVLADGSVVIGEDTAHHENAAIWLYRPGAE